MFTSEPLLAQRIERMIGDIPIVDTRSNLTIDRPGAPNLATLIDEPPLRVALEGVGMPAEVTNPARSPDERVALALPFLRQIRNTSAAWCLFRIFRDLYDFDEPHLTLENYKGLLDRVAQSASDPDWPRQIIENRAKIQTLVAPLPTLSDESEPAQTELGSVFYRLEIRSTPNPAVAAERIRSELFDELDQRLEGRVRFVAICEPPDLANPIHNAALEWHHLNHWPMQVVIDERFATAQTFDSIERAASLYTQARFGLMIGSDNLAPRVANLAGRSSNVFVEGYCGWGAWPSSIERSVLARIERAGVTKVGGFASGAFSAEWIYGSLQATKKATSAAFAQAIASGFFEEDELPPILQAMFRTSPIDWYQLRDS